MEQFRQNLISGAIPIKLKPNEIPKLRGEWETEISWVNRPAEEHPLYQGPFTYPRWYQFYCSKNEYYNKGPVVMASHWSDILLYSFGTFSINHAHPLTIRCGELSCSGHLHIEIFDGSS